MPREIRDLIYEYTYTDTEVINTDGKIPRNTTGLLRACKQTRHETSPYYYKQCLFGFHGGYGPDWHMLKFVKNLKPEYRGMLRDVRLLFPQDPVCRRSAGPDSVPTMQGDCYNWTRWYRLKEELEKVSASVPRGVLKVRVSLYEGRKAVSIWKF